MIRKFKLLLLCERSRLYKYCKLYRVRQRLLNMDWSSFIVVAHLVVRNQNKMYINWSECRYLEESKTFICFFLDLFRI